MTDTTAKNKMTDEGTSASDSMLPALVVQTFYIMAMPYPGTPGTLFFECPNITDILN